MTPRVSVVVPTLGRPDMLERCLAALAHQTLGAHDYEIIVVHDGPAGRAGDVVERLTVSRPAGPAVRYVELAAHAGPAAARNAGWQTAAAEIVAFTDDDTVPGPGWLEHGLAAFDEGVDAVTGRVVMPLRAEPTDYELDAAGLTRAEFVTANCFCRRRVLEALGGFDERFELAWREDSDLHFRLLESGARIVHAPHALVVHPVRPAPWGVSLRQQNKVVFDALLYKKHPLLYRERIRRAPRFDYYAVVASLGACAAGIAAGVPVLTLAGVAAWAALTAWLFYRRVKPATKCWRHLAEMLLTSAAIPPLAVYWRVVGAWRFKVAFV